jgi:hypothetical protein
MSSASTRVYAAAIELAAKGIPVFPCAPNQKRPLTPRGLYDATADERAIAEWFRRWPAANLAIPTGHRSGLLVLDIDCKNGRNGGATLTALEADLGRLPLTHAASTPSGGEHRFFHMPTTSIRNSAGKVMGADAPGLDVRGDGGYVLVSPSVIDGCSYQWTDERPVSELPARWVAVLAREIEPAATPKQSWTPSTRAEQTRATHWCRCALQDEARELAASPVGTRNDRLWRAAAALGGLVHTGAIDADDVRCALRWACAQWKSRSPQKDERTLENGLRFGMANPRRVDLGGTRVA